MCLKLNFVKDRGEILWGIDVQIVENIHFVIK